MAVVSESANSFIVKAYPGDNKTLLAFDFSDPALAKNLAGFTIQCQLPDGQPFYLSNFLKFEKPSDHVMVGTDFNSMINAPYQKYRYVDFAHAAASGGLPVSGTYTYTVTPRYFNHGSMLALDPNKSVTVEVPVAPFAKGNFRVGFTRGYLQSQGYDNHFGKSTPVQPKGRGLVFDTSTVAGTNKEGVQVTFEQIYAWMGETARLQVKEVLNEVLGNETLHLDVFAYDLNEPDIVAAFLKLAEEGRINIILDSASLHMPGKTKPMEAYFSDAFAAQARDKTALKRGCFARYSHDKVLIVSKMNGATKMPQKTLTGSTNWSVTGIYVNANHTMVFDDSEVATYYESIFQKSWAVLTSPNKSATIAAAFAADPLAKNAFAPSSAKLPTMTINVSPHTEEKAQEVLTNIATRVEQEETTAKGNVLFAVMEMATSKSPVCDALWAAHQAQTFFSYGISDDPQGVVLYAPGSKTGVIVHGKPNVGPLPPPFDQVASIGLGHEIHDKFVVCGINGPDPVVWCGSSNLATGGEEENGDNLLEIHDADVAMVFAIEALLLVDHYNFLDRYAKPKADTAPKAPKGAAGKNASVKKAAVKKVAAKQATQKAPAKKTSAKKAPAKPVAAKKATKKTAKKGGK